MPNMCQIMTFQDNAAELKAVQIDDPQNKNSKPLYGILELLKTKQTIALDPLQFECLHKMPVVENILYPN